MKIQLLHFDSGMYINFFWHNFTFVVHAEGKRLQKSNEIDSAQTRKHYKVVTAQVLLELRFTPC